MGSVEDILQLCRLCLVKDQVNIPIFDESSDIRQTFLKISSCLPVKVTREDNLPKRICDECSYKLDMLYIFRNTSTSSEKQLLTWLDQVGLTATAPHTAVSSVTITKPEIQVKQETFDSTEIRHDEEVDAQDYLMQQPDISYQQNFVAFGESSQTDEGPPPKRVKRAAALKQTVQTAEESDEEDMQAALAITKAEGESDDSDEMDEPDYVEAPSTSADDQPGPSGVGKDPIEAPFPFQLPKGITLKKVSTTIPIKTVEIPSRVRIISANAGVDMKQARYTTPTVLVSKPRCNNTTKMNAKNDNQNSGGIKFSIEPKMVPIDSNWMSRIIVHPQKPPIEKDKFPEKEHTVMFKIGPEVVWINPNPIEKKRWPKKQVVRKSPPDHDYCDNPKASEASFVPIKSTSFLCQDCKEKHETIEDLYNHNCVPFPKKPLKTCPICKKTFRQPHQVRLHIKRKHGEKTRYPCEKCSRDFPTTSLKTAHLSQDHTEHFDAVDGGFACKLCGNVKKDKRSVLSHVNSQHLKIAGLLCDICGKCYLEERTLKVHRMTHDDTISFECGICGKGFRRKEALRRHIKNHDDTIQFACGVCGKIFRKKFLLDEHLKGHEGNYQYLCQVCDKEFPSEYALNQHTKTHNLLEYIVEYQ